MKLPKPLTCSEVGRDDILSALINRKLAPETEDSVLAHLRRCPHCLSVMASVLDDAELQGKERLKGDQPHL